MIDLAEDFASDIWLILRLERFTIARSSSATCSAPSSASLKQLSLADRIRVFGFCCCSSSKLNTLRSLQVMAESLCFDK